MSFDTSVCKSRGVSQTISHYYYNKSRGERTVKEAPLNTAPISSWNMCFSPGDVNEGSPFFLPDLCPVVVLFLLFFSFALDGKRRPSGDRNGAGPERLDNPSDQSTIDMTTTYCFEPITFCFQHRAVCWLVGLGKTSHLKRLWHREESSGRCTKQWGIFNQKKKHPEAFIFHQKHVKITEIPIFCNDDYSFDIRWVRYKPWHELKYKYLKVF